MGDLRGKHFASRDVHLCCASCCKVIIEEEVTTGGNEQIHPRRRWCEDKKTKDGQDCSSLKKTVRKADKECKCRVFKLPKRPDPDKDEWELVGEKEEIRVDDKKAEEDALYYYDCFCVVVDD